jgi:2-polyprenyl-6-methoxyphenol hydroxylase-like FAD-dependent oxidoreductase
MTQTTSGQSTSETAASPGGGLAGDASPVRRTDVLVVGGGIGGLAAARGLRASGMSVTLLEQAPEFGEVGAGLQLGPNATRLLRNWGLLERVIAVGVEPANLVFRDAVSGEELTRQDLRGDFMRRYGAPYVVAHRSDLHAIMCAAAAEVGVELVTSAKVSDVTATPSGARVVIADGTAFEADLVLGADGLTSTLRPAVSKDAPVSSGYVAYRGTFPMADVEMAGDLHDVVAWLGPHCHFVQYPLRQGEMLNQVAVFRSPGFLRGESDWGGPHELDEAYAGCHPAVQRMLGYLWHDRRWPMYDREPLESWSHGRVLLTGDAAHPMLQYLAQGACQALEDADALARAAHTHVLGGQDYDPTGWDTAAAAFVAERAPRTAQVQRLARLWGDSWHLDGVARLVRNELFRRRDPDDYRYTDWIYADGSP